MLATSSCLCSIAEVWATILGRRSSWKQRGSCCRCPSILHPSHHTATFLFFSPSFHWIIPSPFTLKRNSSVRRGCFLVSHETKHGRLNHPNRHGDGHEDNPDLGHLHNYSSFLSSFLPQTHLLGCFSAGWESSAVLVHFLQHSRPFPLKASTEQSIFLLLFPDFHWRTTVFGRCSGVRCTPLSTCPA